MNNIPQLYYQAKVTEVDGKGRCKAKYLQLEQAGYDVETGWLQTLTTVYGEGQEGLHSKLSTNDIIIISFLDFPTNQFPFVVGKLQKEVERIDVTEQSIITYNEHTVTFNTDNIEIKHKNGNSYIKIESDTITIEGSSTIKLGENASESIIKGDTFKTFFDAHIHTSASPGSPTTAPTILIPSTLLSQKSKTE